MLSGQRPQGQRIGPALTSCKVLADLPTPKLDDVKYAISLLLMSKPAPTRAVALTNLSPKPVFGPQQRVSSWVWLTAEALIPPLCCENAVACGQASLCAAHPSRIAGRRR
jgi:hypothetical protein